MGSKLQTVEEIAMNGLAATGSFIVNPITTCVYGGVKILEQIPIARRNINKNYFTLAKLGCTVSFAYQTYATYTEGYLMHGNHKGALGHTIVSGLATIVAGIDTWRNRR